MGQYGSGLVVLKVPKAFEKLNSNVSQQSLWKPGHDFWTDLLLVSFSNESLRRFEHHKLGVLKSHYIGENADV